MKIVQVPHGLDLIASDLMRSPGLHISTLYNDLYQDLEPDRYIRGAEPNPLMLALGLAWEAWLEQAIRASGVLVVRPGELITPEGIAYSPDGIIENGQMRLIEYKLTWMSSREDIQSVKFAKYFTQMRLYCYHLETTLGRLYVLHVNGDYKPPTPMLNTYDIEFSRRELADEWQMVQNHGRHKHLLP